MAFIWLFVPFGSERPDMCTLVFTFGVCVFEVMGDDETMTWKTENEEL